MENVTTSLVDENSIINMSECCLYEEFGSCSTYIANRYIHWPQNLMNICDLKDDVVPYLAKMCVIPKFNQGSFEFSECNLILNRLTRFVDSENPYMKICPLHRYTFGIGWKGHHICSHVAHQGSADFLQKKSKKKSSNSSRVVPFHLVRHLEDFPYGGRLCAVHLREIYSILKHRRSLADELSAMSGIHSYEIQVEKVDKLGKTNALLACLEESPLKSQTVIPLEQQTDSAIRRMAAKLRQVVSATASSVAESLAPGEGDKLLQIADLNTITERRSSNASSSSHTPIDERFLEYLCNMFQAYEEKGLLFNEQVRVLSFIPESWNLSSQFIEEKFNCSKYAVKLARQLNRETSTPFHLEEKKPKIRQRLNSQKIDYFISWIIESHLLISIPWGNTNLKLDDGQKISIPRQVLEARHSQIIHQYHQHCAEFSIEPLSARTVYSILASLQASKQKSISGIDDFVKEASDGWLELQRIIKQLPISCENKKSLNCLLENNKLYLQAKYEGHCDEKEQSPTHCTVFALSQEKDQFYSQACNHSHDLCCKDCTSIMVMFDEIEDHINEINDEEVRDELLYDFQLAWDKVFQLMAHRVRAAQQERQKEKYLDNMDESTALLTIDWSQKVLPQQFREGQSAYFGKRGMSLLVGSFVFKNPPLFDTITRTYMLAFTTCSQTEYETLAGGKLILEQFHREYPHISKLIKRSDNASVLAGHATLYCDKIFTDSLGIKLIMRDYSEIQSGKSICDRLSGSGKLRMKAYINSGNDVMNASDIKKGIEYCGGVKNLKIGVGEVLQLSEKLPKKKVSEISSIRNITYGDSNIVLRKATGIGIGKVINYENYQITTNVKLVESFEKLSTIYYVSSPTTTSTKRNDRMFKTFVFCPIEPSINTFECEEDLDTHIALNQHTTKENSLRSNDRAKLILFEKTKDIQTLSESFRSTTTATTTASISRHFKLFQKAGWALRIRKPYKRIDQDVKAYLKLVFQEEQIYGRKFPIEEYVKRIRNARNLDGTKRFNTSQYLTYKQVQNQLKSFSSTTNRASHRDPQQTSGKGFEKDIRERSGEEDNDEPFVNLHEENIFFTEEDEQAVEQAIKLEQLKQMVIDTDIDF